MVKKMGEEMVGKFDTTFKEKTLPASPSTIATTSFIQS